MFIDGIEIDTVDMNEIEVILEQAENPFELQAREWAEQSECHRQDVADGVKFEYDRSGWSHHGCGNW